MADVARALAFFAIGTLLLVVVPDAAVAWRPTAAAPFWAEVAVLGLACLGDTQARRRPVLGLVLASAAVVAGPAVIGSTHTGVLLVFADLLYAAVLHASTRTSRVVGFLAGAVVLAVAGLNLVTDGGRAAVMVVVNLSVVLMVPVLWANEVRRHRQRADLERDRAEQSRRMAALDRAAAIAAERNRMARDLHDVIAGQLSGIAIQSEAALTVPDADLETLRRVLTEIRRGSVASLAEMRTMIGLLRADGAAVAEPRTAPAGLDRIDELMAAGRASGLRVELDDARVAAEPVPAAVDLAAYRIVQESLTNAAKHAPGSSVRCALRNEDGELRVQVENELVRDAQPGGGTGTGLVGLAERAAAVGGSFTAGPDGAAWTVLARLPATGAAR